MANNDILNDNDISLIANMQNIEFVKKRNGKTTIAIIIIAAAIIIGIVVGLIINYNMEVPGEVGKLVEAFNKTFTSSSVKVDDEITLIENKQKDVYSLNSSFVKKDDNVRMDAFLNDGKEQINLGGLFFNPERVEVIFQDDQSVYTRYKDIFNVIKTYLPTLGELTDDLNKIGYQKYMVLIRKELSNFNKEYDLSYYYKEIEKVFGDKITVETDVTIDEDKVDIYKLEMPARDMIELKIQLLNDIKNDSKIRTLMNRLNKGVIDYIEKSKDYESIRMTSDEFNSFKLKYSNELLSVYDEILDNEIKKYETIYSKVALDVIENYVVYVNDKNEIIKIETNSCYLVDNNVLTVNDVKIFSEYNKVKSKEVVPSCKTRLNLAQLDRSTLFETIEIVKNKYKDLLNQLTTNLISNIK